MFGPERCCFFCFFSLTNTYCCLSGSVQQTAVSACRLNTWTSFPKWKSLYVQHGMSSTPFVRRRTRGFKWLCSLICLCSLERCHLHTKICTQSNNVWSSVVLGLGLQHVSVLSSRCVIAAVIRLAIIITFLLWKLAIVAFGKLHIVGKMISEQFQLVLVNSFAHVKSIFITVSTTYINHMRLYRIFL